jgi:hypothetical protein
MDKTTDLKLYNRKCFKSSNKNANTNKTIVIKSNNIICDVLIRSHYDISHLNSVYERHERYFFKDILWCRFSVHIVLKDIVLHKRVEYIFIQNMSDSNYPSNVTNVHQPSIEQIFSLNIIQVFTRKKLSSEKDHQPMRVVKTSKRLKVRLLEGKAQKMKILKGVDILLVSITNKSL